MMSDPILAALFEGQDNYRRKYIKAPGRTDRTTNAYDQGVMEGMRWAIETYMVMKLEGVTND